MIHFRAPRQSFRMPVRTLPDDLVTPILEQLTDRADLCRCALVSLVFHQNATAVLYRHLCIKRAVVREDANGNIELVHPCSAILRKPWYAKYVHHISETSAVSNMDPVLSMDFLAALRLCTNLCSFTWVSPDNSALSRADRALVDYLYVLERLRVPNISIVSPLGLSPQILTRLMYMENLKTIGVCTKHADYVRTESVAAALRQRVTHLDFAIGKCNEPDALFSLFKRLPRLQSLHLREAKSHLILCVLTVLPDLISLTTHYVPQSPFTFSSKPASRLRHLEILISNGRVLNMWDWILHLIPYTSSLESLIVRDLAMSSKKTKYRFPGEWTVPSTFIRQLSEAQGLSLRHLILDGVNMTADDFVIVCEHFQKLEWLAVHVSDQCTNLVERAIRQTRELKTLALGLRSQLPASYAAQYAEAWMDRAGSSQLTTVAIRDEMFEGKWIYRKQSPGRSAAVFEITNSETNESPFERQPKL